MQQSLDSLINLPKHKGRTIKEVWAGTRTLNEDEILQKYIEELSEFFKNPIVYPNHLPSTVVVSNILDEHVLMVQSKLNFDFEVRGHTIRIHTNEPTALEAIIKIISLELTSNFSDFHNISDCWCSPKGKKHGGFAVAMWGKTKKSSYKDCLSPNSIRMTWLFANPSYILWCLRKGHLQLSPNELLDLQKISCRKLRRFELIRTSRSTLNFKPIFEEYQKRIPGTLLNLSENRTNVVHQNASHSIEYNDEREFSGTYASDVAGLSDQDIHDAFEGDPSLYWNID